MICFEQPQNHLKPSIFEAFLCLFFDFQLVEVIPSLEKWPKKILDTLVGYCGLRPFQVLILIR
jgi:hypothetical protein